MTSLYPGTIFQSPGFNRKSTPLPPSATPDDLDKKYRRWRKDLSHLRRVPYNSRPWPAPSPVAGVYDVRNTSTRLILYNNGHKKQTKLRGQTRSDLNRTRTPDPVRHSRCTSPVNADYHSRCLDSSTERFRPLVPAATEMDWDSSRKPGASYYDGSNTNPKYHSTCHESSDVRTPTGYSEPRRPVSRASLPPNFRNSPLLTHEDLTVGEKLYLANIARIYNAQPMIRQKQEQYRQILLQEKCKGLYTRKELERYDRYISLGTRRQYIRPATKQRAKSAYGTSDMSETKSETSEIKDNKEKTSKSEEPPKDEKSDKSPNESEESSTKTTDKPPKKKRPASLPPSRVGKRQPPQPPARSPYYPGRAASAKVRSTDKNTDKTQTPTTKTLQDDTQSSDASKSESSKSESLEKEKSLENPLEKEESSAKESPKSPHHREGVDRPRSRLGHSTAHETPHQIATDSSSDQEIISVSVSQKSNSNENKSREDEKSGSKNSRESSANSTEKKSTKTSEYNDDFENTEGTDIVNDSQNDTLKDVTFEESTDSKLLDHTTSTDNTTGNTYSDSFTHPTENDTSFSADVTQSDAQTLSKTETSDEPHTKTEETSTLKSDTREESIFTNERTVTFQDDSLVASDKDPSLERPHTSMQKHRRDSLENEEEDSPRNMNKNLDDIQY